ncbi:hypothetical protein [Kocuria salsicia]|uniref:hypothetical protein n=1 Tax=Kocuria salsicia TaxID=664639 RepID=UPI0016436CFF
MTTLWICYDVAAARVPLDTAITASFRTRYNSAAATKTASKLRCREFMCGRLAAHAALSGAGQETVETITNFPDGAPAAPAGFLLSISHSASDAVAVAASSKNYLSVGVDIQESSTVSPSTLAVIAPNALPFAGSGSDWPTAWFSAQEAAFKAFQPLTPLCRSLNDVRITATGPNTWSAAAPGSDLQLLVSSLETNFGWLSLSILHK